MECCYRFQQLNNNVVSRSLKALKIGDRQLELAYAMLAGVYASQELYLNGHFLIIANLVFSFH